MTRLIPKPQPGEFAPYTTMYIDLIPDDGRVLEHLETNLQAALALARSYPEARLVEPCAPAEWTIKEILVHVIDDERIFAYRALRFARNDTTELPGFEQDEYVPESRANERDLENILAEYVSVRQATLTLYRSFNDDVWARQGIGSGNPLSVRAAIYHIAGHELHHLESIKENYA